MNHQEAGYVPQINQNHLLKCDGDFVEKLWSLWSSAHANPQMRLTHAQPTNIYFPFFFLFNVFKAHVTDLNRLLKQIIEFSLYDCL